MSDLGAGTARPAPVAAETLPLRTLIGLTVAYAAFGLLVYRGALNGPFISDDSMYITSNPFLGMPVAEMVVAVFEPTGESRHYAGGNYAPVMHVAHAVEARLFRGDTRGYHIVNVFVHALNGALLFALLLRAGLPQAVGLAASALFVFHPANVEVVAWISQLRSLLAMAGALAGLLLIGRAPVLSAALFAAALLSKASASFALPMAAVFVYARYRRGEPIRRERVGLALWVAALAVYTPLQMSVFSDMSRAVLEPYPDLWTHARSILAIFARYLAMAATGYGTAAFHEPEPVRSNLDPWWLAGLVASLCLATRIAWTLRRADPEAGWWLGALAAHAPISQVLPFTFGMGDRYLYFVLPGLIGGTCLAVGALARRVGISGAGWLPRVALAVGLVWIGAFALQASRRTPLWQHEGFLLEDAAAHYPNGAIGHYVRGVLALERSDPDTALAELRASAERGGGFAHPFFGDPWLLPLHADARFQQLVRDMAQMEIDAARTRPPSTPSQLFILANSHYLRGEHDEAIELLERYLRVSGSSDTEALRLVERIRRERNGLANTGPFSSIPATGSKPAFDFPSGRPLGPDEWPDP